MSPVELLCRLSGDGTVRLRNSYWAYPYKMQVACNKKLIHMKKLFLPFIGISLIVSSCNVETTDHTQEIKQMEDSIFANFPTVNRVTIEVKSDLGTDIFVTLGDKELYHANEEERVNVVHETERIIRNVFKDKTPPKGAIIFVEEETTLHAAEGSEKKYPVVLKK